MGSILISQFWKMTRIGSLGGSLESPMSGVRWLVKNSLNAGDSIETGVEAGDSADLVYFH